MSLIEWAGLAALHRIDPERAHTIAIRILKSGLLPRPKVRKSERLKINLAGIDLPNPVGLAAGFDKNAEAIETLSHSGFGFLEFGAATPRPQLGNPKPRLFRLPEDKAIINRFGFNNDGAIDITRRLLKSSEKTIRGLNLGANRDSSDRVQDYIEVLELAAPHIDFATINISSPNTENLRDLQMADALDALLSRVMKSRNALERPIPIFLKVAPDLSDEDIADISDVVVANQIDAIIATNTTIERDGLSSDHKSEAGGLSGAPLFEKSTRALARFSVETAGLVPLIGVGGIDSAEAAYTKIKAGATALQLYSGLIYQGMSLVGHVLTGLDRLLERDGYDSIKDAVGVERDRWL